MASLKPSAKSACPIISRSTLLYVKDTSTVETDKLSLNGRKLIQDARDIVQTTWLMV
jgi:hypothetical protein